MSATSESCNLKKKLNLNQFVVFMTTTYA